MMRRRSDRKPIPTRRKTFLRGGVAGRAPWLFARGAWQLPRVAGLAVLFVLLIVGCNQFNLIDTLGTAGEGGPLVLEPDTATVVKNGTLAFVARGGDHPYRFEIVSGLGSINSDTGVYTAPSAIPAADETIRVVDDSGAVQSATVTVTGTSTGLAVSPAVITAPPLGQVNFVASGGSGTYSFSLTGSGSGSPSIGTTTGVYVAGSSAGTDTVEVSDGISTVSATITVSTGTTDVDHSIASVSLPVSGTAGQGLSAPAAFEVSNSGASNGADPVYWYVYLSQDGTLGPGDYLVDQGSIAGVATGSPTSVDVDGFWPSFTGGANFFIRIFAQDDSNSANDESGAFGTNIDAPDVDYAPSTVTLGGSTAFGGTFSGSFDLTNTPVSAPGDDGTQTVYWSVFLSTDGTFDPDSDIVADTGTTGPLATTASSSISFGGTWSIPATNVFVSIASQDDQNGGNNEASAPISLTVPDVDYSVTAVSHTSGTVSGSSFTGDFSVENAGGDNGSKTVYWTAYVSTDTTLDSSDTVVDTGSTAALPVSGTASPTFSGTWPINPPPPTNFYLLVEVMNEEDATSGNDSNSSGSVAVTSGSDVQNDAQPPAFTGGSTIAAESFAGDFDIVNNGADTGTRSVSWNVFVSTDATYDAGDTLIDSGSTSPLAAAGVTTVAFSGYWPNSSGTYYLIARVWSDDDPTVSTAVDGGNAVGARGVDYQPSGVTIGAAGPNPGDSVSGSLAVDNVGSEDGIEALTWTVYASKDTTLGSGDLPVASGSSTPVAAGGSSGSIPFTGTSPIKYGNYYLIVQTTAGDDVASANDTATSASTYAVAIYDEVPSEPNDDFSTLTDAFDLGVTFEPGMQVEVVGDNASTAGDSWDVISFNTGTANRLRFSWTADVTIDLDIYIYENNAGSSVTLYSDTVTQDTSSLLVQWDVDTPGVTRYVDLTNASAAPSVDINSYSLVITAE